MERKQQKCTIGIGWNGAIVAASEVSPIAAAEAESLFEEEEEAVLENVGIFKNQQI